MGYIVYRRRSSYNNLTVEIVDGEDNIKIGRYDPIYKKLGECKAFKDPRSAAFAAIEIRKAWQKSIAVFNDYSNIIFITYLGSITEANQLKIIAERDYQKLIKCIECDDVVGTEPFGNDFTTCSTDTSHRFPFCSSQCANKDFDRAANQSY